MNLKDGASAPDILVFAKSFAAKCAEQAYALGAVAKRHSEPKAHATISRLSNALRDCAVAIESAFDQHTPSHRRTP
jgi:hypothetical protein